MKAVKGILLVSFLPKNRKDSAFSKCSFCVEFLVVLDKQGIAQLDSLPCYLNIEKISSVKSFSKMRGRVLLGGKVPKAYLTLKMISSWETSRVSAPWRVDQLSALCIDEGFWLREDSYIHLLGSPEFKGPSSAWEVQLCVVYQD